MKKVIILCLFFTTTHLLWGQQFNNCVAACIDKTAIVKEYAPSATCEITKETTGELAIFTVELSETAITPKEKIEFKVAVRDAKTQTVWLYSEATFKEIAVEKILKDCKKGDSILLLTKDKIFALPHSEILIK